MTVASPARTAGRRVGCQKPVSGQFGVSAETLRTWVRRAETDDGLGPGLTSEERERLKHLERENRELRRANEILKSAAAFLRAEPDRRPTR